MRVTYLFLISLVLCGLGFLLFALTDHEEFISKDTSTSSIEKKTNELSEEQKELTLPVQVGHSIAEEIPDKKASSRGVEKKVDMEILLDYRLQKIKEKKEQDKLGTQRLENLIATQAHELNALFELSEDPYDGKKYKWIDLTEYIVHLSENKDVAWASNAEAFLYGELQSSDQLSLTVLRIDCRVSKCEIAAYLNGVNDQIEESPMNRVQNHLKTLLKNSDQAGLFSDYSNPIIFMQSNSESYPQAFTALLYRKTPFRAKPELFN